MTSPASAKTAGEAAFSVAELATASSGLAVRFLSRTPSHCTVTPDGTVTPVAAGSCILSAMQPGDVTYAAAAPVDQILTISPDPALGFPTDTYLMNFEETPTDRLIYSVTTGSGVVYQTGSNPKTSTIPVVGQRRWGRRILKGRQAKVVNWYGSKRLTVVQPLTDTPSPHGGRIRLWFTPPKPCRGQAHLGHAE